VPVDGQTDLARAEQIVTGACHKQTPARRQTQFGESLLVGSRIGLVIAGALGGHDDIEAEARAGNRHCAERLRAVRYRAEPQTLVSQGPENFRHLGPRFEFLISGSEPLSERGG
jgi:hypothetical protein